MYNFDATKLTQMANDLFKEERDIKNLTGWFVIKETENKFNEEFKNYSPMKATALKFKEAIKVLPLSISENAIMVITPVMSMLRLLWDLLIQKPYISNISNNDIFNIL